MTTTPTTTLDPRVDRLYQLLPPIYRTRDVEQGYVLQALLRIVAEQVDVVEDDIRQLYENWFIETARDWAVPYIADLIGYTPVTTAGLAAANATTEGQALNRVLVPRREVANTIRYRRRKGTLLLLEDLAYDVAGWSARAVEYFKLLGWNQNIDHLHRDRARTVDVRRMRAIEKLNGPFESEAHLGHTADIRRINSNRIPGRYNIQSVGLFVWRLQSYSVTHCPAFCAESAGPECMSFSLLGQDAPLFINPVEPAQPGEVTSELNLPIPIRRLALQEHKHALYGPGKSFCIWAEGWNGLDADIPVPSDWIVPADLTGWAYTPRLKTVAVDPETGRFAFPPSQLPKKGCRVTYHYGLSTGLGGGEYDRPLFDPAPRMVAGEQVLFTLYQVGKGRTFHRIADALAQWQTDDPIDAVIELTDTSVYVEPLYINIAPGKTLQLRAADRVRPVIRLLDWQSDLPDALSVTMGQGSRFTLDGLLITGRPVQITGPGDTPPTESPDDASPAPPIPDCAAEIVIRHSTLVPGWAIDCDCDPKRPAEPSLELYNVRARVRIEHSIVGSIQVNEDAVTTDPISISVADSILDAVDPKDQAIGAPGVNSAFATLTFKRATVFGIVDVHAIQLAENSIFTGCVNVARRQLGCMRFCHVPAGCRTPRRYHCQPDLTTQPIVEGQDEGQKDPVLLQADLAAARLRLRPQFTGIRYGLPGYAQLALTCAPEIVTGADDESEMGVFHDLFQPQRQANLLARLNDYTPAGMDVGLIFAN